MLATRSSGQFALIPSDVTHTTPAKPATRTLLACLRSGDYVAKTGTLTFAPGETMKTITIEVKGDSKQEADETFYLDLFGNTDSSVFTVSRGLATILNDD